MWLKMPAPPASCSNASPGRAQRLVGLHLETHAARARLLPRFQSLAAVDREHRPSIQERLSRRRLDEEAGALGIEARRLLRRCFRLVEQRKLISQRLLDRRPVQCDQQRRVAGKVADPRRVPSRVGHQQLDAGEAHSRCQGFVELAAQRGAQRELIAAGVDRSTDRGFAESRERQRIRGENHELVRLAEGSLVCRVEVPQ